MRSTHIWLRRADVVGVAVVAEADENEKCSDGWIVGIAVLDEEVLT